MSARRPDPARRGAIRRIGVAGLVGIALLVAGAVSVLQGDERWGGTGLGLGAIALAVASASTAKHLLPPPEATEQRLAPGTPGCIGCGTVLSEGRRRLLIGGAVGVAAAATGGLVIRDSGAERALHTTAWRRGDRLVTLEGRPISTGDVVVGSLRTAWPEGATDAADAQVVVIRLAGSRRAPDAQAPHDAPEGFAAYSKLCTHMGCPVGLYQQDPDVLVCPCHQAVFDVFDGAKPVQGPARRPLPRLPLTVGDDDHLRAAGGFSDDVGPGWWGRPR